MNVTGGTQRRSGFINNHKIQKLHKLGESEALVSVSSLQCNTQHLQAPLQPGWIPAAPRAASRLPSTAVTPPGPGGCKLHDPATYGTECLGSAP